MDRQKMIEIFEMLKSSIGSALHVVRVGKRIYQPQLAEKLGKDEQFIDDVEQERVLVSFDGLELFCRALEVEVVVVLKTAQFLQKSRGLPEKEVLKQTMQECQYRLWEMDQNKEGEK